MRSASSRAGTAISPSWPARRSRRRTMSRLAVGGVADRPVVRDFDDAGDRAALAAFAAGARRARRPARDRGLSPRSRAPPRRANDRGGAMPRLSADARHTVRLTVNGRAHEAEAEPRMLLTDFLRHRLGLTGTHVGCEHGVCGACTVADRRRAGARLPHARRAGRRRGASAPSRASRRSRAGSRCCSRRSAAITRCNAASARPAS